MTERRLIVAWGVLLLLAGWTAQPAAAQSVIGSLRTCTWIEDNAARLACFDALAKRTLELSPSPQAVEPEAAPRTSAARPRAETERRPSSAARATPAADRFGLPAGGSSDDDDERTFVVASVREAPRGKLIFSMENGQVWEQTEFQSLPPIKPGDEARVKRGFLGGYLMTISGRTIRVKRRQ